MIGSVESAQHSDLDKNAELPTATWNGREPTPIDDFERRLKLCRDNGVRALKDGPLEIVFTPVTAARKLSTEERAMMAFAEAEAAARGGT